MHLKTLTKLHGELVFVRTWCWFSLFSFFSSFSIDATFSKGLGRLVNDAPSSKSNCNSVMRKVKEGSETYLVLYALRDIKIGEELRYDYGVKDLSWRKIKGNCIL